MEKVGTGGEAPVDGGKRQLTVYPRFHGVPEKTARVPQAPGTRHQPKIYAQQSDDLYVRHLTPCSNVCSGLGWCHTPPVHDLLTHGRVYSKRVFPALFEKQHHPPLYHYLANRRSTANRATSTFLSRLGNPTFSL